MGEKKKIIIIIQNERRQQPGQMCVCESECNKQRRIHLVRPDPPWSPEPKTKTTGKAPRAVPDLNTSCRTKPVCAQLRSSGTATMAPIRCGAAFGAR